MRTDTLIKTFNAPSAIAGYTVVTFGAADFDIETADAVGDPLIGVTTQIGSQDNGRCDVIVAGVTEVKVGGTVARGDVLTTNATGQAVVSAAGTDRILGIAMQSAVAGDIASILIAQG